MAKRRIRITPKIRRKAKKVINLSSQSHTTSSESQDDSKTQSLISSSAKTDSKSGKTGPSSSTQTKPKKESCRTTRISQKDKRQRSCERIRDLTISKSTFSKWKPLCSSTKEYIKQIIADTQLNIVNDIPNDAANKDQVHCSLEILQKRIITKMECLRGPDHQLNYKQLEPESKSMDEALDSVNNQLMTLEAELELQKGYMLLKSEEETEHHFEANTSAHLNQKDKTRETLPATLLNLTNLSKESLDRPIPKIPNELEKAAKRLTSVLAKKKCNMEFMGFASWVESLSELQSRVHPF